MSLVKAKDRLIKAAQETFLERGYHGTGTNAIIQRAGVSKGSFFYHFPDKPSIAKACLDAYFEEELEWHLETVLSKAETPIAGVRQFVEEIYEYYAADQFRGGCLLGNLALELSDSEPEIANQIKGFFQRWEGILRDAFAGQSLQVSLDAFIPLFVGLIQGVTLTTKVHKDPAKAKQEWDAIIEFLDLVGQQA